MRGAVGADGPSIMPTASSVNGLADNASPGSAGAATGMTNELLQFEQVRLVYTYLPISQLVMVVNALVFAAVQSLVIEPGVLVGWFAAVGVVALFRIIGLASFRRAAPGPGEIGRWRAYAIAGAAASGLVWGSTALFLYPPTNVAHQVFVAFMAGGMVAGSVTTLTPVFPAFMVFALFTMLPCTIRMALGDDVVHIAMGWLMLIFLVATALIARRSHNNLLQTLELRFENIELIEYLRRTMARAEALNHELLAAQAKLSRINEDLEKRVEERTADLSRTNVELERFAFVASHDLQEPLRNAANFALLLEARYQDKLNGEGREFLGHIVGGVKQMRNLVDGLLVHSRLGAAMQIAPTDSGALVKKVLSNLGAVIAESDAVVTCDPLPVVQADASRLEQVFQNLLSNAIKFRGSEPPRVHVGVEARDGEWVFSVRDNGIGINPRYFGLVFEMFERLHGRERYPGTGIGLAICKKIVESHHGRIWVDSEEGHGSAFSFALPGV